MSFSKVIGVGPPSLKDSNCHINVYAHQERGHEEPDLTGGKHRFVISRSRPPSEVHLFEYRRASVGEFGITPRVLTFSKCSSIFIKVRGMKEKRHFVSFYSLE